MWRAIKNLLPSAKNLWKRKVLQESICQRCNRNVESINHTLLDSKATKKIWIQGPQQSPPQYSNAGCSQLLPRNGKKNLRKSELELMVVYCWTVWYSRNKFIFEGQKLEPSLVAAKAESFLAAY